MAKKIIKRQKYAFKVRVASSNGVFSWVVSAATQAEAEELAKAGPVAVTGEDVTVTVTPLIH